MEDKFIRVFHNQLVGKDYVDFDLYNLKGILIHEKSKKIDPSFLLMINYIAVYRKEEPVINIAKEFENDDLSLFLKELIDLALKKEADNIEMSCSNDDITILFLKNSSIIEKSGIDGCFYLDVLDKIKTLFDIKIDFADKEYFNSTSINVFDKTVNITLRLLLNRFNKFNMIFKINNNF